MQRPPHAPVAAIVQMTSGIDPDANLRVIDRALAAAAAEGAAMAFFPEMSLLLDRDRQRSTAHMQREADSPWPAALADMARRHHIWLHSGSMPLLADDGGRRVNRSHVIDDKGEIRARYDKIHMFDVDVSETESYRESAGYRPGDRAVLARTALGAIGMTVCYDLRFPHLYRALAQAGAQVLTVPAAFSTGTGPAHWEVLLRARAIETCCFVLAPAQTGQNTPKRATYGHSLAIAPWGEVILDAGTETGVHLVDLDLADVDRSRRRIPSLFHDREFEPPQ